MTSNDRVSMGLRETAADGVGDDILLNLERLHTTDLGALRIRRNLRLNGDAKTGEEVAAWCRLRIKDAEEIVRNGKNWYITASGVRITVNAQSYTIITAHPLKVAPY